MLTSSGQSFARMPVAPWEIASAMKLVTVCMLTGEGNEEVAGCGFPGVDHSLAKPLCVGSRVQWQQEEWA